MRHAYTQPMSLRHWPEPRRDMLLGALAVIAVAAWIPIIRAVLTAGKTGTDRPPRLHTEAMKGNAAAAEPRSGPTPTPPAASSALQR